MTRPSCEIRRYFEVGCATKRNNDHDHVVEIYLHKSTGEGGTGDSRCIRRNRSYRAPDVLCRLAGLNEG